MREISELILDAVHFYSSCFFFPPRHRSACRAVTGEIVLVRKRDFSLSISLNREERSLLTYSETVYYTNPKRALQVVVVGLLLLQGDLRRLSQDPHFHVIATTNTERHLLL